MGTLELGYKGSGNLVWSACAGCGKERWVQVRKGKLVYLLCASCNKTSNKNCNWKGGRTTDSRGYVRIKCYPDDFFYPMVDNRGYVFEHRLVVAKALGRCLHLWEIVHHKHDKYPTGSIEDKQDNRYPENLEIVSDLEHKQITIFENKLNKLRTEIRLLRLENKKLKRLK